METQDFILNSDGDVIMARSNQRRFIIYKASENIQQAISYFHQKEYDLADSIFKIEQIEKKDFFFMDEYLTAISFQQESPEMALEIVENLAGKKLIRAENTEYVCLILKGR